MASPHCLASAHLTHSPTSITVPIEHRLLRWLLCLPLLTDIELSVLCRIALPGVRVGLRNLRVAGWLFERTLSDPSSPDDHVYALSARGVEALMASPEAAAASLDEVAWWQCSLSAVALAIAQAPMTRGLNRSVAALAGAIAASRAGSMTWAAPQPTARHNAVALRPRMPWGSIEMRWQAGDQEARAGLHFDSALTPVGVRRRLLSAWQQRHVRDASTIVDAPVLIVCEQRRGIASWSELYRRMAERRSASDMPRLLLGLAARVSVPYGIDERVWYAPMRGRRVSLLEMLLWQRSPSLDYNPILEPKAARNITPPKIGHQRDAQAAVEYVGSLGARATAARRIARVALTLDRGDHRAAAWLASQPWMSPSDLSAVEQVSEAVAARRFDVLAREGVALRSDDNRWALTTTGMQLAAARRGMANAPRTFRKETSCVFTDESPEIAPAHDAGISNCMGLVARSAQSSGWSLTNWMDERYWVHEIDHTSPRPDAAFILRRDGEEIAGCIEYEQSQARGARFSEKMESWRDWYAEERWRGVFPRAPVLLVVLGAGNAERQAGRRWQEVGNMPAHLPVCAANIADFGRDGLDGAIWHPSGGGPSVSAIDVARSVMSPI